MRFKPNSCDGLGQGCSSFMKEAYFDFDLLYYISCCKFTYTVVRTRHENIWNKTIKLRFKSENRPDVAFFYFPDA